MIEIRPATITDAPLLPAVEHSAGQAFLSIDSLAWIASDGVVSVEEHVARIELGTTWVAVDGLTPSAPVIAGFLSAELFDDVLHIWELAVSSDYQRQRLGQRLIETTVEWSQDQGLRRIELTTFVDVPWNQPYYERLGFDTLARGALDERLRRVLDREIRAGLPGDRRCAMAKRL